MPKKLVSISGADWMRGLSTQTSSSIGGIFRQAGNWDPFEKMGFLVPSKAATRYGDATITKTIRYMVGMDISGPFIIGYADGAGASHLYKINAITGAVTDESAAHTSSASARGLLFAKNRLLYARTTTIRSLSATLTGDAEILTGLTDGEHPMVVGADLNVYGIDGGSAANNVFKIVSATATTGNTISAFALESGMFIRDIKNTGRYLVMIADNRSSSSSGIGTYACTVAFWNYTDGTLAQRFDFYDSAMLSCSVLDDGNIFIKGGDNDYLANITTYPVPIRTYRTDATITTKPTTVSQVVSRGNKVLWGDSDGRVWGYGRLTADQKRVYFQPWITATGGVTALVENAGQVWAATDVPSLYGFWEGSTRNTATAYTTPIIFDRLYKITHMKIVTRNVLTSGQSIGIQALKLGGGGGTISLTQTFSFTADGGKQIRVFEVRPNTDSIPICHEIDQIQLSTNANIQTIEIWGDEVLSPLSQEI